MTQIISIFSTSPGEGKRTVSQGMAKLLGQNQQRVLLVELDFERPSFAITTGLTHPTLNIISYLQSIKDNHMLNFDSFLLNTRILSESNKRSMKVLPSTVDLLTNPLDMDIEMIPELIENKMIAGHSIPDFMKQFVENFRDNKHDVVIFILPHDLESLFTLPIIQQCDMVLHVVTTNPTSLIESRKITNLLKDNEEFGIKSKWKTIINKYSSSIPKEQIDNFLPEQEIVGMIGLEQERVDNDLTDHIGSEQIDFDLSQILKNLSFNVAAFKEKRAIFNIGGRK